MFIKNNVVMVGIVVRMCFWNNNRWFVFYLDIGEVIEGYFIREVFGKDRYFVNIVINVGDISVD